MKVADLEQLVRDIKKEGSCLKNHFLDLTQLEYDELKEDHEKMSGFVKSESHVYPKKFKENLQIEGFLYYGGLVFFLRIKDKPV